MSIICKALTQAQPAPNTLAIHFFMYGFCAKAVPGAPFCNDAQQRKLNAFVKEYNKIRPHEALGMKTPAKVHKLSKRPFPERIPSYEYSANQKVMKVTSNGGIRWKSYYWIYMTRGFIGKHVGAEEIGNGIWKVFYRDVFLGFFNEKDIRDKEKSIRLSTNLV